MSNIVYIFIWGAIVVKSHLYTRPHSQVTRKYFFLHKDGKVFNYNYVIIMFMYRLLIWFL